MASRTSRLVLWDTIHFCLRTTRAGSQDNSPAATALRRGIIPFYGTGLSETQIGDGETNSCLCLGGICAHPETERQREGEIMCVTFRPASSVLDFCHTARR